MTTNSMSSSSSSSTNSTPCLPNVPHHTSSLDGTSRHSKIRGGSLSQGSSSLDPPAKSSPLTNTSSTSPRVRFNLSPSTRRRSSSPSPARNSQRHLTDSAPDFTPSKSSRKQSESPSAYTSHFPEHPSTTRLHALPQPPPRTHQGSHLSPLHQQPAPHGNRPAVGEADQQHSKVPLEPPPTNKSSPLKHRKLSYARNRRQRILQIINATYAVLSGKPLEGSPRSAVPFLSWDCNANQRIQCSGLSCMQG